MDFVTFSNRIQEIRTMPLPGLEAQLKMAPEQRRELMVPPVGVQPKQAGVMAIFYPMNGQPHLLLILRNTYNGVHSNQIGLPGGRLEAEDANIEQAAIREAWEEVGALPQKIEVLRGLSPVYIPPSNFEVWPFVGLYDAARPFVAQDEEVAALVEVPLLHFMDDEQLITQELKTSYAQKIRVPAFKLNGYVVWGATAMMLSELKGLLKELL